MKARRLLALHGLDERADFRVADGLDALEIGESDAEEGAANAHIWLSAANAAQMAENLAAGLADSEAAIALDAIGIPHVNVADGTQIFVLTQESVQYIAP